MIARKKSATRTHAFHSIVVYPPGYWQKHRALSILLLLCLSIGMVAATAVIANLQPFSDPTGNIATYNTAGSIDESTTTFFQNLGTNGRTCGTCHVPSQAMSFSAANAQALFAASNGTDPLFAAVDGANCPTATTGDPSSHSLILNNGLIRISLTVPATAQFTISAVHDPYACALVTDPKTGQQTASVYRRPLPTTNLGFLSTVMFDGRETLQPLNNGQTFRANLVTDLKHQALDATLGHAQAAQAPTDSQLGAIVSFELGLFTGQVQDNAAGNLYVAGAQGGPVSLSGQGYYPGINDSLGGDPTGTPFNSTAFTIYTAWEGSTNQARAAIAAGERLFNTLPLTITGCAASITTLPWAIRRQLQERAQLATTRPTWGITRSHCRWTLAPAMRRASKPMPPFPPGSTTLRFLICPSLR